MQPSGRLRSPTISSSFDPARTSPFLALASVRPFVAFPAAFGLEVFFSVFVLFDLVAMSTLLLLSRFRGLGLRRRRCRQVVHELPRTDLRRRRKSVLLPNGVCRLSAFGVEVARRMPGRSNAPRSNFGLARRASDGEDLRNMLIRFQHADAKG